MPVYTVGDQIMEAILLHQDVTKEEAENSHRDAEEVEYQSQRSV